MPTIPTQSPTPSENNSTPWNAINSDDLDLPGSAILFLLIIYGVGVLLCWGLPKLLRLFYRRNRPDRNSDEQEDLNASRPNIADPEASNGCLAQLIGSRRANRLVRGRQRYAHGRLDREEQRHVHAYVQNYHPYNCYPGAPTIDDTRKYLGAARLPSYHRSLYGSNIYIVSSKTPSPASGSSNEDEGNQNNNLNNIIMNTSQTAHAQGALLPPSHQMHIVSGNPQPAADNLNERRYFSSIPCPGGNHTGLTTLSRTDTTAITTNSSSTESLGQPPSYSSKYASNENIVKTIKNPGKPPGTVTSTDGRLPHNPSTSRDVIILVPCSEGHLHDHRQVSTEIEAIADINQRNTTV